MPARPAWLTACALAGALGCSPKPPPPNLGCDSFAQSTHVELCERIRESLVWERGGHSTPFGSPHWQCTRESVETAVCARPALRVDDVSAAYAELQSRGSFDSNLAGCLFRIQRALEAPNFPKDDLRSQDAVTCPRAE